jgi:biopolymer transport protein ExbD
MKGLGEIKRGGDKGEGIDIAPLIDVVFILLIFFMVSTTFVRNSKIDIERPGAASATKADVRAVRVTVPRSGQIMVEGETVHSWMVQDRVRTIVMQHPDRPVLITADEAVETGKLIDIVDQCKLAGAANVGVDVKKKQ